MTAGIFIMDIRLDEFLDYGEKPNRTQEVAWDKEIKAHAYRLFPKGPRDLEGSSLYNAPDLTTTSSSRAHEAEMSFIERKPRSQRKFVPAFPIDFVTFLIPAVSGCLRRAYHFPWSLASWVGARLHQSAWPSATGTSASRRSGRPSTP